MESDIDASRDLLERMNRIIDEWQGDPEVLPDLISRRNALETSIADYDAQHSSPQTTGLEGLLRSETALDGMKGAHHSALEPTQVPSANGSYYVTHEKTSLGSPMNGGFSHQPGPAQPFGHDQHSYHAHQGHFAGNVPGSPHQGNYSSHSHQGYSQGSFSHPGNMHAGHPHASQFGGQDGHPPGLFHPGHFPPSLFHPGHFPPSHFHQGHFPPGHFPPGHFPPGHFPPPGPYSYYSGAHPGQFPGNYPGFPPHGGGYHFPHSHPPHPAMHGSAPSHRPADATDREMEELRRQIAALKAGAASPAAPSPQSREVEELRRMIAELKQAPPPTAPDDEMARENERLKQEIAEIKAAAAAKVNEPTSPSPTTAAVLPAAEPPSAASITSSSTSSVTPSVTSSTVGHVRSVDPAMMTTLSRIQEDRLKAEKALKDYEMMSTAQSETVRRKREEMEKQKKELDMRSAMLSRSMPTSAAVAEANAGMEKFKGVDVAFLMDCTGSMSPYIDGTRTKIIEIMRLMPTINPEAKVRLAFVGYRDFDQRNGEQYIKIDFTLSQNVERLAEDLGKIQPISGTDIPEDVTGGLYIVAKELTWRASTRLVIHFGDAPCHGRKYHNFGDNYPDGDPEGRVPEDLLQLMCRAHVDYTFVQIHKSATNQMVGIFRSAYDHVNAPQGRKGTFTEMDLSTSSGAFLPKAIANTIMESIRTTMTRSVHLSASTRKSTYTMT